MSNLCDDCHKRPGNIVIDEMHPGPPYAEKRVEGCKDEKSIEPKI